MFPTYISGGSRSVPLDFLALGSNVLAGSPATLHNPLHCFDRSGPCNSSRSGSRGCRADPRRACRTFSQRRFRLRTLSTLRGLDNCSRLVHLDESQLMSLLGIFQRAIGKIGYSPSLSRLTNGRSLKSGAVNITFNSYIMLLLRLVRSSVLSMSRFQSFQKDIHPSNRVILC